MSKSVNLSPNHGVNPTIPICFWCGEPKNEIALLGKLKGDAEAPMYMVFDYEPCDKCKEFIEQGIQLIGSTVEPAYPGMPPIAKNEKGNPEGDHFLYPDRSFVVVREEFIREFLSEEPQEFIDSVIEKKALILPAEVLSHIMKEARESEE